MSAAAPPSDVDVVDDALSALLRLLAPDLAASPSHRLRIERLRISLAARGVDLLSRDAAPWLAPVICRTKDQQAAFPTQFAWALAALADRRPVRPDPPEPGPTPPERPVRHVRGRAVIGLALVAIVVCVASIAVVGAVFLFATGDQGGPRVPKAYLEPHADRTVLRKTPLLQGPSPPTRQATPPPRIIPWRVGAGLAAAAVPLAVVGIIAARRHRRRYELLRDDLEDTAAATKLALSAAIPSLFDDPLLPTTLAALGVHGARPGSRLDIQISIRRTIAKGGFPTFVQAARAAAPEYLFCIDEASPRDHLAVVGEAIFSRLRGTGLSVRRFGFFEDPALLVEPEARGARHSLPHLAAGLPHARLLLMAETNRLVDADGRTSAVLTALPQSMSVALINPRRESEWSGDERQLEASAVRVLPASPKGLSLYADWLRSAFAPRRAAGRRPPRLDLATLLERDRRRLLFEGALSPPAIEELLDDMTDWLGVNQMRLVRTLAVFPRLEPALTVALAEALHDPRGNPLLSHPDFLQTSRLVWLRSGYMPDSLRRAFVKGLTAGDLATAVLAIRGFLSTPAKQPRRFAMDFRINRPKGLRPPKRVGAEVLQDSILVKALDGRLPHELGVEAPLEVVRRIVQEARRRVGLQRAAWLSAFRDLYLSLASRMQAWIKTILAAIRGPDQRFQIAAGALASVVIAVVSASWWFGSSKQAARPSNMAPAAAAQPPAGPFPAPAPQAPGQSASTAPRGSNASGDHASGAMGAVGGGIDAKGKAKPVNLDTASAQTLSRTFASGLVLPDRQFTFGSNYQLVAKLMGAPSFTYSGLPRAGEYLGDDIRYLWVYDNGLPGLDAFLQKLGGAGSGCIGLGSYITFFFKAEVFFHISIRLEPSAACPSYDWLRKSLFGAGNAATIPDGSNTTNLTYHDEADHSILEITRLGVAQLPPSIYDETAAAKRAASSAQAAPAPLQAVSPAGASPSNAEQTLGTNSGQSGTFDPHSPLSMNFSGNSAVLNNENNFYLKQIADLFVEYPYANCSIVALYRNSSGISLAGAFYSQLVQAVDFTGVRLVCPQICSHVSKIIISTCL